MTKHFDFEIPLEEYTQSVDKCVSITLDGLTNDEIKKLIDREIIHFIKSPFEEFEIAGHTIKDVVTIILNIEYSEKLLNYVYEHVRKIVKFKSTLPLQYIFGRAKTYSFDDKSEKKYLKKQLKKQVKELHNLDFSVDHYDVIKMFLSEYMMGEGLIEFIETGEIKGLKGYGVIVESIEGLTELNKIEKIKERIKELSNSKTESNDTHPRIFRNESAFKLFEQLKESVENELADYSFIFRAMQRDQYIYPDIKTGAFINWLQKNYDIVIGKIKLYDYCKTPQKVSIYTTAKLLYKP